MVRVPPDSATVRGATLKVPDPLLLLWLLSRLRFRAQAGRDILRSRVFLWSGGGRKPAPGLALSGISGVLAKFLSGALRLEDVPLETLPSCQLSFTSIRGRASLLSRPGFVSTGDNVSMGGLEALLPRLTSEVCEYEFGTLLSGIPLLNLGGTIVSVVFDAVLLPFWASLGVKPLDNRVCARLSTP